MLIEVLVHGGELATIGDAYPVYDGRNKIQEWRSRKDELAPSLRRK